VVGAPLLQPQRTATLYLDMIVGRQRMGFARPKPTFPPETSDLFDAQHYLDGLLAQQIVLVD
jgi:hypothetical protein